MIKLSERDITILDQNGKILKVGDIVVFNSIDKYNEPSNGLEYEIIDLEGSVVSSINHPSARIVFVPKTIPDYDKYNNLLQSKRILTPSPRYLVLKKPREYSPINMTGRYRTIGD